MLISGFTLLHPEFEDPVGVQKVNHHCFDGKTIIFGQLVRYDLAKKLSKQALIRGSEQVERNLKIIKRTCSPIRDLRVGCSFEVKTRSCASW